MRALIGVLICLTASAQMPPVATIGNHSLHNPLIHYAAVAATDGTNVSGWSNEVAMPDMGAFLTFSNSTQPGVQYLIGSGTVSHIYTQTNSIGTATATAWPVPVYTPKVMTLTFTDRLEFSLDLTNWQKPDVLFFRNAVLTTP